MNKNCIVCGSEFIKRKSESYSTFEKRRTCCRACADKVRQGTFLERFWRKVVKGISCWLWVGPVDDDGYGHIGRDYSVLRTHRVSWELHNGEISEGEMVLHTCDVPACVNPSHLFLGNSKDNAVDRNRKGRWRYSGRKLNPIKVKKMRDQYSDEGVTHAVLAERFGVSNSTVGAVVSRATWKDVD